MARPEPGVRHEPPVEPRSASDPPIDPSEAIHHAYRFHRAKRRARVEHRRRTREAGLRFYVILVVLVFLTVVLGLTIWNEIQRLFGL
jgi:predicted nucleic acid-binding Zn ribbon protein